MIATRKLMIGNKIHKFAKELWPINGGITLKGVKLTLKPKRTVETVILDELRFDVRSIGDFIKASSHENDNRLVI